LGCLSRCLGLSSAKPLPSVGLPACGLPACCPLAACAFCVRAFQCAASVLRCRCRCRQPSLAGTTGCRLKSGLSLSVFSPSFCRSHFRANFQPRAKGLKISLGVVACAVRRCRCRRRVRCRAPCRAPSPCRRRAVAVPTERKPQPHCLAFVASSVAVCAAAVASVCRRRPAGMTPKA